MSVTAYHADGVFVHSYALIATERIHRVAAALGGAAAMVIIGAARGHSAFFSEDTGIDWNVIFLLLGMMIIVGVLRQTGVFEFLAIWSAQRSKARPFRMMVLLCLITAGASALLDNVTTVLLIAPVTLLVTDRLGLNPIPYLLAEAMASNIGGAATLIGDPPNIIIASRAGLTFNDFLIHLAPIVVVLLVVFLFLNVRFSIFSCAAIFQNIAASFFNSKKFHVANNGWYNKILHHSPHQKNSVQTLTLSNSASNRQIPSRLLCVFKAAVGHLRLMRW